MLLSVRTIGGSNYNDAAVAFKAIHLSEDLVPWLGKLPNWVFASLSLQSQQARLSALAYSITATMPDIRAAEMCVCVCVCV